jgi:hypothetical protein
MIENIVPSAKKAERDSKAEAARLQGEAVLASFKMTADYAVGCDTEMKEGKAHEYNESAADRTMEYGSPKGGMK